MSFLLVHILYVLILIKFPIFGKQKLLKKKKTIHIVFVTFVIVTAALGPIVSWATGSYQLTYLPPQICVIRSTVVITYAQLVPFMTQFCVVIVLTLVLSYEVYNVSLSNELECFMSIICSHTHLPKSSVNYSILSISLQHSLADNSYTLPHLGHPSTYIGSEICCKWRKCISRQAGN